MSNFALRLALVVGVLQVGSTAVALAGPVAPGAKPPALLEPYAGYSLVFGPGSERVLGADANPLMNACCWDRLPTVPSVTWLFNRARS
jgi:hypothetical protein